jgi:hypothetical protein
MSVVSSFLSKATTLVAAAGTGGAAVPVYFGEAALKNASGVQPTLPLVVIEDEGSAPDYEFELGGIEVTTLRVSVFATTLVQIDTIVLALKYGGDIPSDQAGLDFGTLTGLGDYLTFMECKRVKEQRNREHQEYTQTAQIAHKAELIYEVRATITDG